MNTQLTLICFLSVLPLTSCVDLKAPPSVENCSDLHPCKNSPNDGGWKDTKGGSGGTETMPGTDSDINLADADDEEDAGHSDTAGEEVRITTDSNGKFDGSSAETPLTPVEPHTGAERGPEPPVEPSSPDTKAPMDTQIPDSGIPDTHVPDTRLPDTHIPDTNLPDSNLPDANTTCPVVYVSSGGKSITHSGLDAYCILTCDVLDMPYFGWGCYNFEGRKVKVNGKSVDCGQVALPSKVNGHYLFEVSAGSNIASAIAWWGQDTESNCPYTKGDPVP